MNQNNKTNKGKSNHRYPNSKGGRTGNGGSKIRESNAKVSDVNDSSERELSRKGRDNDPNWYFTSPELAKQAAQLSFQNVIGDGTIMGTYQIPSLHVLAMNPSPGTSYVISDRPTDISQSEIYPYVSNTSRFYHDGINLSAQKLYTLLSSFSGRTSSYAPQDVATMILAIGEVASLSEHIRRYFGIALTYNERNRTMPLTLLDMMGCNTTPSDPNYSFQAVIADARMRFNIAMTRINQIPLIDSIGYIRKCRDMYQKVYLDSPTNMAQMIVMVPATTWYIDEESNPNGTRLETMACCFDNYNTGVLKKHTIEQWILLLEEQIDKLLNSSTLNVIYADLLNLANKIHIPMWKFDYLAENYIVIPEYNENFLLQYHNMDVLGYPEAPFGSTNTGSITKEGFTFTRYNDVVHDAARNGIVYNPIFAHRRNIFNVGYYHDSLIDMSTDSPSIEDNIEALRFAISRSGYHATFDCFGHDKSEIGAHSEIICDTFNAIPDHYCVEQYIFGNNVDSVMASATNTWVVPDDLWVLVAKLSQFRKHPFQYLIDSNGVGLIEGEMEYPTTVDFKYLARLNRLMFAGLFDLRL